MESFLTSPLPTTISELEDQIAFLEQIQEQCAQAIQDFTAREDVDAGIVYAREIHDLRRQKNMFQTHKEFRVVRLYRLKAEESGAW